MDLKGFETIKLDNGNVIFGPLSEKAYKDLTNYFNEVGIGFFAEILEKKKFSIVTNNRQLIRNGITL